MTPTKPILTRRQIEVLKLVAEGLSDKEIADPLFISTRTVNFHLHHAYLILKVNNRLKAVNAARRLNLL